jgi:cytochrome c oxidase cbb3-type subunit III
MVPTVETTGETSSMSVSRSRRVIQNLITAVLWIAFGHALALAQNAAPSNTNNGSSSSGEQLFTSNCAGCHGLDARGGEHAPNIATTPKLQQLSDADLLQRVRDGVPAAGMPAFRSKFAPPQLEAVVSYLRTLQGKGSEGAVRGNPEKGRDLFFGQAHCGDCHAVAGRRGFAASDLSTYGQNHTAAQIRESIVNPDTSLNESRGVVAVTTRSGEKYKGIARNEDNFSLQLQTLDGAFHFFDKSNIARIEHPAHALVISQYGSTLTTSDLDDLASFLKNPGRN